MGSDDAGAFKKRPPCVRLTQDGSPCPRPSTRESQPYCNLHCCGYAGCKNPRVPSWLGSFTPWSGPYCTVHEQSPIASFRMWLRLREMRRANVRETKKESPR